MGYNRVLGHFTNSQELAVPWQTGQLYLVNQVVINSNLMYLCNTQHTSGATFAGDSLYWTGLNPAATVGIAQGGTGQTTQTAAFDALATTTTAGDLIVYNGTDNVRQGIGSDGQVLIADSSQPNKLKWATAPSGNTNFITNGSAESNNTTGWATYAESDAVTFTDAGDLVSTVSPHGLSNGNQISFTSITSTTGISTNTLYYVISATSTTFQVASSLGGAALPLTTNGSGTMVRFAPKTGSGGLPSVTIAANGTNPLIGSYSFLLTKGPPNREGQGWSYDFTIDRGYQAKVLQISFNYIIAAANTFVAGTSTTVSDVTVWIYDVTNAVVIQPSSSKLLSNSATVSDTFNATFQTASNSTSYRLIFHVSTPSTTDYTLKVDGITVSPSTYVYGTPVTDWQSYTPTFTGFGTATTIQFQYRRVGADLEVRGKFTAGTTTATEGRVSFPSGLTSGDTSIIPSLQHVGMAALSGTAANSRTVLIEPSVTYFTFGVTTSNPLTKANGSTIAGTGETCAFFGRVPIQGWSSSVQTSDQTDTRVVAANYTMNASTSSTAVTTSDARIDFNIRNIDTHGATTTGASWSYLVPVSGVYKYTITTRATASAIGSTFVTPYVNGSPITNNLGVLYNAAATAIGGVFSGLLNLNSGNTLDFRASVSVGTATHSTAGYTNLSLERISGPSAIAASETVTMSAYLNANANVNADAIIIWNTKEFDSHSAYSTTSGQFTAPISGTYEVSTYVYGSNPGTSVGYFIWKNNSKFKVITWQPSGSNTAGYALIKLNAGDTVDIRPDTGAPRVITGGALNTVNCSYMQITKIGNL